MFRRLKFNTMRTRTRIALRLAPWIPAEVALQEVRIMLDAIPDNEMGTATASLLRTINDSYRRQALGDENDGRQ